MLSDDRIRELLRNLEADNVERTVAIKDSDKIGEAICAFSNDLADRRTVGVLILGANDDGSCGNLNVTEQNQQTLLGFRDGRIVPIPSYTVRKAVIDACELALVEVQPADNPPVRYRGRVCVRHGQRRGYATADEERRLSEKRIWGNLPFDHQPVKAASLEDLDLDRFRNEYLPQAIARDVLRENQRTIPDQLKALRLAGPDGTPTSIGLLVVGRDPRRWIPGAYVQFLRVDGLTLSDPVKSQREISGPLSDILRELDELLRANINVATDLSTGVQLDHPDYPLGAMQELVRNAVIHRNYASSNAPTRVNWFSDRVEIWNPGGPYGQVTVDNFGEPYATDYRNPGVAEAAKVLGFAQRFGSGLQRARTELLRNGNPPPQLDPQANFVQATVRLAR
jgi:ATP-dependent DNA helicase RecG